MQKYVVGGYVRDKILGRASGDRDWVVVGGNDQAMLAQGFARVGEAFPVYIHAESGEEYALARQERKVSAGHGGFVFDTETISLEDDLLRRDLTINAIAKTDQGQLVDPYGGYRDMQSRLLRHVSPAFSEDPLRVLRVARFAAQLASFGFRVSPDTLQLMTDISNSGELQTLPSERVFQETRKALASDMPSRYFMILRQVGALAILFPEIDALFGVPQNAFYHPEIDSGVHVMMVLDQSARLCTNEQVRFACLCHDLGKAITPKAELPSHKQHEIRGVPLVRDFCAKLKAPKQLERLALLVCEYHLLGHRLLELKASTLVTLFNKLDAWRRPETVRLFILCCECDSRGRSGFQDIDFVQKDFFLSAFQALYERKIIPLASLKGADIQDYIFQQRCLLTEHFIRSWQNKKSP